MNRFSVIVLRISCVCRLLIQNVELMISNRDASETLVRLPVFIKRRVVLVSVDVQYRRSVFAVGVATNIVAKETTFVFEV